MNILLVEPDFPIPPKSRNHKNFLPIGLLKIGAYLKEQGHEVKLVRGEVQTESLGMNPDTIMVTSLFTYWADYVRDAVRHYKRLFPDVKIIVGGIYASLMPEHCRNYTGCDEVFKGVFNKAERYFPDYSLLPDNGTEIDYQIVHASRGCIRRCPFCGTWKIEPSFEHKRSIKGEVRYRKVIFYDNNFLANPNIKQILNELIELKRERRILWCESQSGFDGRLLLEKPHLAVMLRDAGFRYPRIAWDGGFEEREETKKQIDVLVGAGYKSKDIYVFMLYNWEIPFEEMERKRIKCWKWKVQIADCRYRPLIQTFNNYNSRKAQNSQDYFIHPKWADSGVKQFRKNVREQNIGIRLGREYDAEMEKWGRERRKARRQEQQKAREIIITTREQLQIFDQPMRAKSE